MASYLYVGGKKARQALCVVHLLEHDQALAVGPNDMLWQPQVFFHEEQPVEDNEEQLKLTGALLSSA